MRKEYFQKISERGIVSSRTFWDFVNSFLTNESSLSQNESLLKMLKRFLRRMFFLRPSEAALRRCSSK